MGLRHELIELELKARGLMPKGGSRQMMGALKKRSQRAYKTGDSPGFTRLAGARRYLTTRRHGGIQPGDIGTPNGAWLKKPRRSSRGYKTTREIFAPTR